jgi:hypothetical protein
MGTGDVLTVDKYKASPIVPTKVKDSTDCVVPINLRATSGRCTAALGINPRGSLNAIAAPHEMEQRQGNWMVYNHEGRRLVHCFFPPPGDGRDTAAERSCRAQGKQIIRRHMGRGNCMGRVTEL